MAAQLCPKCHSAVLVVNGGHVVQACQVCEQIAQVEDALTCQLEGGGHYARSLNGLALAIDNALVAGVGYTNAHSSG